MGNGAGSLGGEQIEAAHDEFAGPPFVVEVVADACLRLEVQA